MPTIHSTNVSDAVKITGERHEDSRGFFQEIYNHERSGIPPCEWVQTNWSKSDKYVLRGIHVAPYHKLVTCVSGRIFDVCVDLRPDSSTYLQVYTTILDSNVPQQVYIPAHCGHAFLSLEWDTSVIYMQGGSYNPNTEHTIHWSDPSLTIHWPVLANEVILSDKDRKGMSAKELERNLRIGLE